MADRLQTTFTVISMGGKCIDQDLGDCLVCTCTNMTVLSEMTGISRNRLAYYFGEKKKNVMKEFDFIITKSEVMYKGRQRGGVKERHNINKYR